MNGPSFFSFHLSFSIYFPKVAIFYYYTSIHGLQEVENHCALLREKFHISAFPMCYSLYNWIGEHEITKLKKKYLLRIPRKRTQKKAQKDMNEMEWRERDGWIFSNAHA